MREPSKASATPLSFLPVAAPRKSRMPAGLLQLLGILAVMAGAASIPLWTAFATWADHEALMRDLRTIAGPPCPAQFQAWPDNGRAPMVFHYKGVSFERRHGGVYCEAVTDGPLGKLTHPVCQFTAPGLLTVTTARGAVTWQPPIGRNATVTVREGRARCVVGGWWR